MAPRPPKPGQSLADLFPDIAAQADGWDPTTVTAGSNFKGDWVCDRQHKWQAMVGARTGQSQGCPFCSGRRAWRGFNDLATVRPDVAARAAGWDPTSVTQGSHHIGEWRCDVGHIWRAQVKSVVLGQGCAVCAGQQVQEGVNDLRTLFPAIARELVNPDDYLVTANSHRLLRWRCALNHEWQERVHKRTRRGDGCPYCSGHRLLAGFNDVASRRPEIVGEVDGWDPTQVYYRSDVQLKWRCREGHRWKTSAEARAYLGSDCPTCNNFRVEVGVNDLATTHPELAAQAVGWDPRIYLAGSSSSPLLWCCDLGHEWKTTIGSRAGRGSGCPFCAYKQVMPGFNDLATTHQHLVDEVDGWDPTTVIAGTNRLLSWKCSLGHTWKTKGTSRASRTERTNGVSGCPVCSGNRVLPGFNDLATTHPEIAAAAVGWDPTTVSKGHQPKLLWHCEAGHEWRATTNSLTQGSWCPSCAKTGFDPNKDGWLYFLDNDALDMLQIGISNVPKGRLGQHSKRGWEVIEVRGPMEGHLARELETNILHAIERRGAVLGHKASIEKFDGYSEAWTKASLVVSSFKELLDFVYEDDEIHK